MFLQKKSIFYKKRYTVTILKKIDFFSFFREKNVGCGTFTILQEIPINFTSGLYLFNRNN